MKVTAFNGSARKDGNTAILINHVFEELGKEQSFREIKEINEIALVIAKEYPEEAKKSRTVEVEYLTKENHIITLKSSCFDSFSILT